MRAARFSLADGVSVVSGSMHGDVRFWDLRTNHTVMKIQAHRSSIDKMTALGVHNYMPILARYALMVFHPPILVSSNLCRIFLFA